MSDINDMNDMKGNTITNQYTEQPISHLSVPERESVKTLTRNVIASCKSLLFSKENLRWLIVLFLFVNTGFFGFHRVMVKKFITGALMALGFCFVVAFVVLPFDTGSMTYQIIMIGAGAGALFVLGFYLVDLRMILAGKYSTKDGQIFTRVVPGLVLFGIIIVIILNIELLVSLII